MPQGPLVILSGPSGSGKSTVVDRLLRATNLPLRKAVTATTRDPRAGETDGLSYHFWKPERFEQAKEAGELLEWAQVHGRDSYGTPRSEVDPFRKEGTGVILVIDVQGAEQIRKRYPGDHLSLFLTAGSLAEYERRLRARGTEDEETIQRRLKTAEGELARENEFMFTVVNDDLGSAVAELEGLIRLQFDPEGKKMLDDLKEEGIVNKVGGRFKLSTLIQKRMVALNTGAKPMVDLRTTDKMAIVIQEILQDKIYLDLAGNVQTRNETASEAVRNAVFSSMPNQASDD
jgi:guanylate kinase